MKTIYFIIIVLFLAIGLQAQVEKTIENTAGNLNTLLSDTELSTITDLTVTGTLDARDFKTMRNSMPVLSVLDIEEATITEYKEAVYDMVYPANRIPASYPERPWGEDHSLSEKTSLTSIILPATADYIESEAFRNCTGLISVEFPSGLTAIGQGAFKGCTSLLSLDLPSSITVMGWESFHNCTSLVSVNIPSSMTYVARSVFDGCISLKTVVIPSSVKEIWAYAFYNCISLEKVEFPSSLITIEDLSFSRCRSLSSVILPSSVKTIGMGAFSECSSLSKVIFPRTLERIGSSAFADCINLKTIYAFHVNPLELPNTNTGVFYDVDKTNSTLYVPAGSKELYASAEQWKDFQKIVEMPLFQLPDTTIIMQADQQTTTFDLETNEDWTVHTDETWLSVAPLSGTGNQTFTITADINSSSAIKTAIIQISIADSISQDITVIQKAVPIEINITEPGTLAEQLTGIEIKTLSELIITGEIDARDFVVIRDQMPLLEVLDLRGATIKAYSGGEGPYTYLDTWDYPANEIPDYALQEGWLTHRKDKLTTLYLPETCTSVGGEALSNCIGLEEVIFPPSVVSIDYMAFDGCTNLKSINLPSVTRIESRAFRSCRSLADIHMPAISYFGYAAFQGCIKLHSVVLPATLTKTGNEVFSFCFGLRSVEFGDSLTEISEEAFFECINLRTINIPKTVTFISGYAFYNCNLQSIYCYLERPIELHGAFLEVDKSTCILYVPFGTKEYFEAAEQWKDFLNIIEMEGFELSYTELTIGANPSDNSIEINTQGSWTAVSDMEWLKVSPASGNSSQRITINALENNAYTDRTATITFTALNGFSQTVTIIQNAKVNSIPVANAGTDQTVEEDQLVQLDGSASMDADHDTLIYMWSAPVGIILSSTTDTQPTFTAPKVEKDTAYTFNLVVKDGMQTSVSDRVIITIINIPINLELTAHTVFFESKESTTEITITGNAEWTVSSDQPWLTVSPDEGTGEMELALMAEANDEFTDRMAIVTVSAAELDDQTITVTQKGLVTNVEEIDQSKPLLSYYPNPFTENIIVEIRNPKQELLSVDIYNMAGQRVKNLTIDNRAEKITLSWDGSNELGQKVPNGMYLLKMNDVTRQIVKGE